VTGGDGRLPGTSEATASSPAGNTLRERAYRSLKAALMSGGFKPGTPLTIRVLSEALGVGAMPAREAVQQLVVEGGLELLPNRSVRVVLLDRADVEDVFDARLLLEPALAERAAGQARPADREAVGAALAAFEAAVGHQDPSRILQANVDLHFAIYAAARSATLHRIVEQLWLRIGPLLIQPFRAGPAEGGSIAPGLVPALSALAGAVERGDGAEAGRRMHAVIGVSRDWYRRYG